MEAPWLASQLEAGRSIESIARETGRAPSTVAYWVNEHGLASQHAPRHATRGGLTREQLEPLVAAGVPIRKMAERLGVSYTTVRHWLRRYGLTTPRGARIASSRPAREAGLDEATVECPVHGPSRHVRRQDGGLRCLACRSDAVSRRRRRVKAMLVREFGGACRLCGFDRYAGALQFHHVDPATKRFQLGGGGLTRPLAQLREEARKCVLLCANCHAMVEAGVATLPQGLTLPAAALVGSSIGRG
jgi:transposase-like protein